ncbi:GroES-like protein [Periconia macrospinosa]|uniref:GroES-like protein n=1 Tax=Periconia macrospinosa TaxID=97972 RepID=A0A2V1D059_9PLEO|nr:GroES-like protein [Periconia macrospinosa]
MVFSLSKWRRRSSAKVLDGNTTSPYQTRNEDATFPETQSALLLHAIRTPYEVDSGYKVPTVQHEHEVLVKVIAVGLNPIDWKAPDFNFGIPTLPYISGRELVGTVLTNPSPPNSRIKKGTLVIIPSTDYRDLRKAAFQNYAIASSFNSIRLPSTISPHSGSILGVAFVSAALTLGICMGVDFSSISSGPDLLKIVHSLDSETLPSDIRAECLHGITPAERARKNDTLIIWGGGSTVAHIAKQIARLAGLKIISVVDTAKHGLRLSSHPQIRPDLVVDSYDAERAISIIQTATDGNARFGFDTVGKESASHLLRSLGSETRHEKDDTPSTKEESKTTKPPTPPHTPSSSPSTTSTISPSSPLSRSHLIGLTGLPKPSSSSSDNTLFHTVPIKLFHEVPAVGEALSAWCERLLVEGKLVPPDVVGVVKGLEGIEEGLGRLRRGEIRGGRLVGDLE